MNFCHLVFTVRSQNLLTLQKRKAKKKKTAKLSLLLQRRRRIEEVKNVNDSRRGVNDLANCLRASLASLHQQLHVSLVSALPTVVVAYLITASERRFLRSGNQSHLLLGHRGWMLGFLIRITTVLEPRRREERVSVAPT